jgi:cyclopropane fatty-acyl-phospholipid synthase-like methyltransferase
MSIKNVIEVGCSWGSILIIVVIFFVMINGVKNVF